MYNPTTTQYATDNDQAAYSKGPWLSQEFSAITANTTYLLGVGVGWRLDNPSIPNWSISLLADGVPFATADFNDFAAVQGQFVAASVAGIVLSGSPLVGQTLGIRLDGGPGIDTYQANFDDVSLVSAPLVANAIPEPSSLSLLGLGAVGMVMMRRRRSRSKA